MENSSNERRNDSSGSRNGGPKRDYRRSSGGREGYRGSSRSDGYRPKREGGKPYGDRKGPKRYDDRGPRKDGGKRYDDRGPKREGGKPYGDRKGPKRYDDRGPRKDGAKRYDDRKGPKRFDDRGPKRDGDRYDRGPRKDGPKRYGDHKGPKRYDDRGPKRYDDRPKREGGKPYGDRKGPKRYDERGPRRFNDEDTRKDQLEGDASSSFAGERAERGSGAVRDDDKRTGEHREHRGSYRKGPKREDRPRREGESTGFKGFAPKRASVGRSQATPARLKAYEALVDMRENRCYASESIDRCIMPYKMPQAERAFARLLVTEVVCRMGSLDELIDSVLTNPEEIEDNLRDALRISFCELFYLDKPAHVAVDQGVELVRSFAPQASRLANFALRQAADAKDEFPFGDPETDEHAATLLYGFPQWLVTRLSEEWGHDEALRFMKRSNEPAPLFFMVNVAHADGGKTLESLVKRGLRVVPIKAPFDSRPAYPIFAFAERNVMGDSLVSSLLKEGDLIISDAVAQSVALLSLPDEKPNRFLEIGAGRGTKTILLQNAALARYGSQMELDTLDKSERRTDERTSRLKRARIKEEQSFVMDATDLSSFEAGTYDAVFIDAPCSGAGTLRRHPEIRWRLKPDAVSSLAAVSSSMLKQAARLVAPGGRLTYATCTIFNEENHDVIAAFLEGEGKDAFELVCEKTCRDLGAESLLTPACDAHYVAVLKRKA